MLGLVVERTRRLDVGLDDAHRDRLPALNGDNHADTLSLLHRAEATPIWRVAAHICAQGPRTDARAALNLRNVRTV
jgi:hypothetical protein